MNKKLWSGIFTHVHPSSLRLCWAGKKQKMSAGEYLFIRHKYYMQLVVQCTYSISVPISNGVRSVMINSEQELEAVSLDPTYTSGVSGAVSFKYTRILQSPSPLSLLPVGGPS